MRESTALGAGFDRFAGIAGGALTSACYLLGIEVEPDGRDGRPHFIDVDVDGGGAEVRSRRTVLIPRGGMGTIPVPGGN